jgi:hypothetical protein
MAWANRARLSGRFVKGMFRRWRSPPPPENVRGVPRAVMRQIQDEGVSSDPVRFQIRLQELLENHRNGGQHG